VANTTDDTKKINSLISKLALPRGLSGACQFNGLAQSGTPDHSIGSLGFLAVVSHQFCTQQGAAKAAARFGRVAVEETRPGHQEFRPAAAVFKREPGRTLAFRRPSNSAFAAGKQAAIGLHCARLSPALRCMLDLSLRLIPLSRK
jgi:hypothetical protein